MESLFRSLVNLQERLRQTGIPSAVIGGMAVSVWGEPRVTRDVGVKVMLTRKDAAPRSNQFEQALDGSTLVAEYRRMRGISR